MKQNVKRLTKTGLCVAILCVLSVISLPIGEVPYSLALLGVFLIGGLLPPGSAGAACFCYLLLGLVGIPVFSRFSAGPGVLFGPTGGYLIAYPLMAMIESFFYRRIPRKTVWSLGLGMGVALLFCYGLGTLWFMWMMERSFVASLLVCVVPFLWFDLMKAVVAGGLVLFLDRTQS